MSGGACNGAGGEAKPASEREAPAAEPESEHAESESEEPVAAEPKDESAAASGLAERSNEELKRTRTELLKRLNEGREHVKAGRVKEGIAAYEALLKIDPHYNAALGELGWAHFKAGALDEAEAFTQRALLGAVTGKQRGPMLYNLGRIAEERGDTEAAVEYYLRSLDVRPNKTVQARLDALQTGTPMPAAAPSSYSLRMLPGDPAKSFEEVCEIVRKKSVCSGEDVQCTMDAPADRDQTRGGMLRASGDFMGCLHPVVKTPAGYRVFETALLEQQGSEVDQAVDKLDATLDGDVLLITFEAHLYERDWDVDPDDADAIPPDSITHAKGIVACLLRGTDAGCTIPLHTSHEFRSGDDSKVARFEAELKVEGTDLHVSGAKQKGRVGASDSDTLTATVIADGVYPLAELTGLSVAASTSEQVPQD